MDMVCLWSIFRKFYLVHSWILCPIWWGPKYACDFSVVRTCSHVHEARGYSSFIFSLNITHHSLQNQSANRVSIPHCSYFLRYLVFYEFCTLIGCFKISSHWGQSVYLELVTTDLIWTRLSWLTDIWNGCCQ